MLSKIILKLYVIKINLSLLLSPCLSDSFSHVYVIDAYLCIMNMCAILEANLMNGLDFTPFHIKYRGQEVTTLFQLSS